MTAPAEEAAAMIRTQCGAGRIDAALILSRSFYGLTDLGERGVAIPYAELPGFPIGAGAEGGELIVTRIEGATTAILRGCPTFYETGDPSLMATPIEALYRLGVRAVLSTGLARLAQGHYAMSAIALVTDHINFTGLNPLIGSPAGASAMVDMGDAYDKRLLRQLKAAATAGGVTVYEGVLMWFSGPSFETPAEMKVAGQLGADIVGWQIAPEAILARRFGLPFAGVAVLMDTASDLASGGSVAGVVAAKRLVRSFLKTRR